MWPRLDKEMCFAYVKGEEKESKQKHSDGQSIEQRWGWQDALRTKHVLGSINAWFLMKC